MDLFALGYDDDVAQQRIAQNLTEFDIARIIIENKERYVVLSQSGEHEAQITGKLRFTATSKSDFPAVGDWVAITEMGDDQAIIHEIIKRKSFIARKVVNRDDLQIIAANIDIAFITTAVDFDFNLNRIDRYLSITNTGLIQPILLLTKTDLISESELIKKIEKIKKQHPSIPLHNLSITDNRSFEHLISIFEKGKTYCFLWSSGVGKSTIINKLIGREQFKTNKISYSTNKKKHTTTHRELVILKQNCVLIDTPGMREIGITADKTGIENTFTEIAELAISCRFHDCTLTNETGCAVLSALKYGDIDIRTYENYQKLERERIRLESSFEQKRKNDKKFGKMCKQIMNEKKKTKY